jgi:hypothetical protein
MTKVAIASLNRPKEDEKEGTVHSQLERESKSGRKCIIRWKTIPAHSSYPVLLSAKN